MFSVKVLAIEYSGELLQVEGIQDSSDTIVLSLDDDVKEAIKNDELTLNALIKKFSYIKGSSHLGEMEAYHFSGRYGALYIYTTSVELEAKQIQSFV